MDVEDLPPLTLCNVDSAEVSAKATNMLTSSLHSHRFSRRGFIHSVAGATALALGSRLSALALTHGDREDEDDDDDRHETEPAPNPIPGGSDLSGFGLGPPYDFIHFFAPGPVGLVLPFTGVALEGLNVEPSTITDFRGSTALAYHVGEVRGSDGHIYNLETDIRAMKGRFVAADGTTRNGTFALL